MMVGGLGLAAASVSTVHCPEGYSDHSQVERALTLVATRTLTIEMAHTSKGKNIPLSQTVNLTTGKDSMHLTGFSHASWGKPTRAYTTSASMLKNAKFELILQDAKEFLKPIRSCNKTTDTMEIINIDDDDDDERVHLVDNSGDESN